MAKYDIYDSDGNWVGTAKERDDGPDWDREPRSGRMDIGEDLFSFLFGLVFAIIFFISMRNAWNDSNFGMVLFLFFPFFGFAFVTIKSLFEVINDLFDF